MIRKLLIGAVALVALCATPAAAQYTPFVVNPGQVSPGGTVTVEGDACQSFEEVQITLTQAGTTQAVVVATVTADASGHFSASFTVPADAELGTYVVAASCGTGVQGQEIEVVAPAGAPSGPGAGTGGTLPRTGADLNSAGLIGAGLLTAGGLLLVSTRGRRRDATA